VLLWTAAGHGALVSVVVVDVVVMPCHAMSCRPAVAGRGPPDALGARCRACQRVWSGEHLMSSAAPPASDELSIHLMVWVVCVRQILLSACHPLSHVLLGQVKSCALMLGTPPPPPPPPLLLLLLSTHPPHQLYNVLRTRTVCSPHIRTCAPASGLWLLINRIT
jgi:hypothetical protein